MVLWALSSSDAIKSTINQHYKIRHEDDLNVDLSIQPWGSDGDKRRYFLIEGKDDTAFRVYRESNPAGVQRTWWSVAGSIDELNVLAEKLETQDGGPKARTLAKKIHNSIPRFEATEEASFVVPGSLVGKGLTHYRNADVASTARCARNNSSAPRPEFQCTKVGREVNV